MNRETSLLAETRDQLVGLSEYHNEVAVAELEIMNEKHEQARKKRNELD